MLRYQGGQWRLERCYESQMVQETNERDDLLEIALKIMTLQERK